MENSFDSLAVLEQISDAFERSWSIGINAIEERVLFFCDTNSASAKALAQTAKDLGIHDSLLSEWAVALPSLAYEKRDPSMIRR